MVKKGDCFAAFTPRIDDDRTPNNTFCHCERPFPSLRALLPCHSEPELRAKRGAVEGSRGAQNRIREAISIHYETADLTGNSMFTLLNVSEGTRELISRISMPNSRPVLSISTNIPSWSLTVLPTFPSWNWIYRASAWSSKLIFILLHLLQPICSKNNYPLLFLLIYYFKSIAGKFLLGKLTSLKTGNFSVGLKHSLLKMWISPLSFEGEGAGGEVDT